MAQKNKNKLVRLDSSHVLSTMLSNQIMASTMILMENLALTAKRKFLFTDPDLTD